MEITFFPHPPKIAKDAQRFFQLQAVYPKQGNNISRTIILGLAVGLGLKAALTGGILVAIFLIAMGCALYRYLG